MLAQIVTIATILLTCVRADCTTEDTLPTLAREEIIEYINHMRIDLGRPTLTWDTVLARSAGGYVHDGKGDAGFGPRTDCDGAEAGVFGHYLGPREDVDTEGVLADPAQLRQVLQVVYDYGAYIYKMGPDADEERRGRGYAMTISPDVSRIGCSLSDATRPHSWLFCALDKYVDY